jgi:hypothetical protein
LEDRIEDAFDHTQFHCDWEQRVATCPGEKTSLYCSERKTWRGTPNLYFAFPEDDCRPCPPRQRCSRAKTGGRTLTIYPQEQYEALMAARQRQKTGTFKKVYGERAGIEGTISRGVGKMGPRRSRYFGLSRTHSQHVATAAAINAVRVVNWLAFGFF